MIVIVDYGMGNLRSIQYKLGKQGVDTLVSSDAIAVERADKLILPGVGAFASGMKNLERLGLLSVLNKKVMEKKSPILGICLGMQLLAKCSEEGNAEGLGWIDAQAKRFNFGIDSGLRVPHVGWNTLDIKKDSLLLSGIAEGQRFYFTHSYYVDCADLSDVVAVTEYGIQITSVLQRDNIFGTQFHPEKSHRRGIDLILNFIRGT
jgi:glutamine amidotransferase